MPLESASYISGLDAANPPSTDLVADIDNHVRLIKSVLKATFPNLTGAVTSTQERLNNAMPRGGIIMWGGLVSTIPTGWALCDGGTYPKADGSGNVVVPDLRTRFVKGAAIDGDVGVMGGSATHTHVLTVAGHTLTTAEIPSHTHTVNDPGHAHAITDPGHTHATHSVSLAAGGVATTSTRPADPAATTASATTGITVNSASTGVTLNNAGGGGAHDHTATAAATSTDPLFLALAYIYKL